MNSASLCKSKVQQHTAFSRHTFLHVLSVVSSEYHPSLQTCHAQMSNVLRKKVAREPRFPLKICPQTFELIMQHLKRLGYKGPLALACDDTKLNPSLRIYFDGHEDCYYLVGCTSGPLVVPDPDALSPILQQAKGKEAMKVCCSACIILSWLADIVLSFVYGYSQLSRLKWLP